MTIFFLILRIDIINNSTTIYFIKFLTDAA